MHFGPEPFSKSFNLNYVHNYLKIKKKILKVFY